MPKRIAANPVSQWVALRPGITRRIEQVGFGHRMYDVQGILMDLMEFGQNVGEQSFMVGFLSHRINYAIPLPHSWSM